MKVLFIAVLGLLCIAPRVTAERYFPIQQLEQPDTSTTGFESTTGAMNVTKYNHLRGVKKL